MVRLRGLFWIGGNIKFEKFWQVVQPILKDGKYRMPDADTIMDAFTVFIVLMGCFMSRFWIRRKRDT